MRIAQRDSEQPPSRQRRSPRQAAGRSRPVPTCAARRPPLSSSRLSPKRRVLTHFLASRLAATGVTVNALAPALSAETGMLPGDPAQLRPQVPVGRLGQPCEVADLAAAILANAYLTNQVISTAA